MQLPTLRLLHTSDWHTGRTLYGRHRYAEFAAFFDWLYNTIVEQPGRSG
jgi:exonuclease SbcD